MRVHLKTHQREALEKLGNGKILTGDVGTGKSLVSIAYYYINICEGAVDDDTGNIKKAKKPVDLYIITTARKRDTLDWLGEVARFGLSLAPEENDHGGKIYVDSWNMISKYTDIKGAFFIFDEQRLVGSGAWVKAFYKIAAKNQWILLSATPGDTWEDYIPVFVANGFYKNKTDFTQQHAVYNRFAKFPKIDRFIGTKKLQRLADEILVPMPMERHTTRHKKSIIVGHDKDKMKTVWRDRWNPYTDEPIQEVGELFYTMRRVANSDPERLEAIVELLGEHPRLIVFYNFDYELEILRTVGPKLGIVSAEWNGHKHEPVPETDRWIYLVQYYSGAEGWNCTTTNALAFYSLTYSYRSMYQAEGRIDRMNTPYTDLHYYTIRSASGIDLGIWKALSNKKNFNERTYLGQKSAKN